MMLKKTKNRLSIALEQTNDGFYDENDIKLIENHLKICLEMGFDATRIAEIIDGEKVIKHYDQLVGHGAKIMPEALLYGMGRETAWKYVDWFIDHGVRANALARYFKGELYSPAYKPIELAVKLLKIGASKHLVFELYAQHLKSLTDTPEELICDLGELMDNGIDRHRIMFWIEKYMEKSDIVKYAEKLERFGIDANFYEESILKEYGVNIEE